MDSHSPATCADPAELHQESQTRECSTLCGGRFAGTVTQMRLTLAAGLLKVKQYRTRSEPQHGTA
jgi:hypothetical protein